LSECKINTSKSAAFLYTNSKDCENVIRKTIPITEASRKFKNLEINLIKEMKDLYKENYKSMKTLEDGWASHVMDW
jgi:hypothetical protein